MISKIVNNLWSRINTKECIKCPKSQCKSASTQLIHSWLHLHNGLRMTTKNKSHFHNSVRIVESLIKKNFQIDQHHSAKNCPQIVRVARAILCYVKSLKLQFLRAANRRSWWDLRMIKILALSDKYFNRPTAILCY